MQTFKAEGAFSPNVAIVEGKLAGLITGYTREFRENGTGFEEFSDESIIYSLLEYSKFPRNYTLEERIKYIYQKCCEYSKKEDITAKVVIDEIYGNFVVLVPQINDNPF